MKRFIFPFILAIVTVCSCDKFIGKDNSQELKEIEAAKLAAIDEINSAKKSAVANADTEISAIVSNTVKSANEDLSSVINSAKNEIESSIQTSVSTKVEAKLQGITKEISNANRLVRIVGIIAIIAVIICIFLVVKLNRITRDFKDDVIHVIKNSERIRDFISQQANSVRPVAPASVKISERELEDAVFKCISGPKITNYLHGLINLQKTRQEGTLASSAVTREQAPTSGAESNTAVKEVEERPVLVEKKLEPKYELFARDSETDSLSGIQNSFQKGKSIYKLLLLNKDDRYADITLCVEQEGVQKRILNANIDMLTPICNVQRKSTEPQRVIVEKAGRAEMTEQDSWKVTVPINVVLE